MAVVDDLIIRRAREAVEMLSRTMHVRAAYLFGSHVEGTADRFSDIDVALFVEGLDQWDLTQRVRAASQTQRQVGDDIEIHFMPAEHIDSPPPASFAAHIQKHGVPIYPGE